MKNNKRIVFLCSGGGGNLRFIKTTIDYGWLGNVSLVAVLTDRYCQANEYSQRYNIPNKSIDFSNKNQLELINSLSFYQADIIVTTVHKILSSEIISKFDKNLINLHYSLLPAFAGLIGTKTVKQAISYGAKFTGVTVHFVDNNLDQGQPIFQTAIPLRNYDNLDTIMDIIFRCGCLSLFSSLNYLLWGDEDNSFSREETIMIKNHLCLFSSKVNIPFDVNDEDFWQNIKFL